MITCRLAVCAESVIRDVQSRNVSVFNILEQIKHHRFPLLIPKVTALFMLVREEGDPETLESVIKITLAGEEVWSSTMDIDFQGKSLNRCITEIRGFPIQFNRQGRCAYRSWSKIER